MMCGSHALDLTDTSAQLPRFALLDGGGAPYAAMQDGSVAAKHCRSKSQLWRRKHI